MRDYDPAVGRYVEPDPIGLHGGSYTTYSYAAGNPIGNRDALGLWSFSFGAYAGIGGAIVIGQDPTTGAWFYGGRLGFGVDIGWSLDPNGKRPGAEETKACGASTTFGTYGSIGANAGPLQYEMLHFGAGIDPSTGESYHEEPAFGSPTINWGSGESVEIGGSIGIQVIGHF